MKFKCLLICVFLCFGLIAKGTPFVTKWKPKGSSIVIPTNTSAYTYNYDIEITDLDGTIIESRSGVSGNYTSGVLSQPEVLVKIKGEFPQIYFNYGRDHLADPIDNVKASLTKIISVEQWGDIKWQSMEGAFFGCDALQSVPGATPAEAPDFSEATEGVSFRAAFAKCKSSFNANLNGWDVSKGTDFSRMFNETDFFNNGSTTNDGANPLTWKMVDEETGQKAGGNFASMFYFARHFNQNISSWDVSEAISFSGMFRATLRFNNGSPTNDGANPLTWKMEDGTNKAVGSMQDMFRNAVRFNQNISSWNVSGIGNFHTMFGNARVFNNGSTANDGKNPLSWKMVSGSSRANGSFVNMFKEAKVFNQDISSWNVSGIRDFHSMFRDATIFNNGDIGNNSAKPLKWTMVEGGSKAKGRFTRMFLRAVYFNQELEGWDMSQVHVMDSMFYDAFHFNQKLNHFKINALTDAGHMLDRCAMDTDKYDAMLISWAEQAKTLGKNNILFGAEGVEYCASRFARKALIDRGWGDGEKQTPETYSSTDGKGITDGDEVTDCFRPFVSRWKPEGGSITIPTASDDIYNYDIQIISLDYAFVESAQNITGNYTSSTLSQDEVLVLITGTFPRIYFNNGESNTGDVDDDVSDSLNKIISVEQWGDIEWRNMSHAFHGCGRLTSVPGANPDDCPDLTIVSSFNSMFFGASSFNSDISDWDVSRGGNFSSMFFNATSFNQDIGQWNVSNCNDFTSMFNGAINYNNGKEPLSWTYDHDKDSSTPEVSATLNGERFNYMFYNASSFNQDVGHFEIDGLLNARNMLDGSGMDSNNYDALLMSWANQAEDIGKNNIPFSATGLKYCTGIDARKTLIDLGWGDGVKQASETYSSDDDSGINDGGSLIDLSFTLTAEVPGACSGNTIFTLSGSQKDILYQVHRIYEGIDMKLGKPAGGTGTAITAEITSPWGTSTYYVVASKTGACEQELPGRVTVKIEKKPVSGRVIPEDSFIDFGETVVLKLEDYEGSIVRWESSTSNFMDPAGTKVIDNTTDTYTTLATLSETTVFRAVVETGECGETSSVAATVAVNMCDFGDAPDSYGTIRASNGPEHRIVSEIENVYLGTEAPDFEIDGQPTGDATGDNNNGINDEDGLALSYETNGSEITLKDIPVVNNTGEYAYLYGWIDIDSQFKDSQEQASVLIERNFNDKKELSFTGFNGAIKPGKYIVRLRVGTVESEVNQPTGFASDGEVEDHEICVYPNTIKVADIRALACYNTRVDLNSLIQYTPHDGKEVVWAYSKGTPIAKPASYKIPETDGDVIELHYTVTENHCGIDVEGQGKLFLELHQRISPKDKTVEICVFDDMAENINLNSVLGVATPPGEWSNADGTPLAGHRFNGRAAYGDSTGAVSYTFKYKSGYADRTASVTIIITNEY